MFNNIKYRLKETFGSDLKPQQWLFIVGCYNSGTTLLHKVLSGHPEISSMQEEGQEVTDLLEKPKDHDLPRLWAIKPEIFKMDARHGGDLAKKLRKQWSYYYSKPLQPTLIEKSISNTARIKWLNQYFHNARFIALIRNGYAVAEGIHRKTGHPISLCAKQWHDSNKIMLEDLQDIEAKLLIRYEDFTEEPEKTIEQICSFINLPCHYKYDNSEWEIHEKKQAIKNMNVQSFERLSDEDIKTIDAEAGLYLRQLGYFL